MPKEPGTEFWRDLKPIANAMKPDAQPEVFHQFAPIDDERYYVPLSPPTCGGARPNGAERGCFRESRDEGSRTSVMPARPKGPRARCRQAEACVPAGDEFGIR